MSIQDFGAYVFRLEKMLEGILESDSLPNDLRQEISVALNGGPSKELRSVVDTATLRAGGVFFTGDTLADQVVGDTTSTFSETDIIADPACGAGDLLVRCARRLPVSGDLISTLQVWGEQLIGYDLHPEFIKATKIRLILTAIDRAVSHSADSSISLQEVFPRIRQGDYRDHLDELKTVDYLFLNPPYNSNKADPPRQWASGLLSTAAVFLDDLVTNASAGTAITAILPDVLRSGRRYARWRRIIADRAHIRGVDVFGLFDRWTDVDVFVLRLIAGQSSDSKYLEWHHPSRPASSDRTVGEMFEVHVGSVVPHRDPLVGPEYPFIHARSAKAWDTLTTLPESRAFSGTVFEPPFVVVRRTSAPGDAHRAVGTIVQVAEKVAVENHLMVLTPKNKSVDSCHKLLTSLRRKETSAWLNQRIRCRHLTVSVLRELPIHVELQQIGMDHPASSSAMKTSSEAGSW
jgi:hypothetical protein